jgi:DNA end-binding protein Ku
MFLASCYSCAVTTKRFDPNEYADEHKARVEAAIQKKVAGKEISLAAAPAGAKGGNVIDLMEALRASIDARGSKAANLNERRAPKRAAAPGASRNSARARRHSTA